MKKLIKTTPDGARDLLALECEKRRAIERDLMEVFRLRGFREISTPAMEYYDIFSFDTSYIPLDEMYKLTDLNGRLLVLRPDITVPIARIVATHLKDEAPPIRLCYREDIFRLNPGLSGRRDEIAQCGVELIGGSGIRADLEIITAAVAAIRSFSGEAFRFEIGHVGFVKSLLNALPVSQEQKDEIQTLIRVKNYALLKAALKPYEHLSAARGLMRLPSMFGGGEVLAQARELSGEDGILETIDYLEKIYNYMFDLGLSENLIIDLGSAPENPYYTGIVFQGFWEGLGSPILSGGRYDRLLCEFGRDLPATGFAIYVDEAVKRAAEKEPGTDGGFIVHAGAGFELKALNFADSIREKGVPCVLSGFEKLSESVSLAKAKNARNLVFVGDEIKYIIREGVCENQDWHN